MLTVWRSRWAIGADHVIDVTNENLVPRVAELTKGRLADLVIDLSAGAVEPVRAALDMVRVQGDILLAGLKAFRPVEIISDLIVLKGLTVHGGSGSTASSMRSAVDLLNTGALPTDTLLGEVFTLDQLEDAMALLQRTVPGRDAVRVGLRHG